METPKKTRGTIVYDSPPPSKKATAEHAKFNHRTEATPIKPPSSSSASIKYESNIRRRRPLEQDGSEFNNDFPLMLSNRKPINNLATNSFPITQKNFNTQLSPSSPCTPKASHRTTNSQTNMYGIMRSIPTKKREVSPKNPHIFAIVGTPERKKPSNSIFGSSSSSSSPSSEISNENYNLNKHEQCGDFLRFTPTSSFGQSDALQNPRNVVLETNKENYKQHSARQSNSNLNQTNTANPFSNNSSRNFIHTHAQSAQPAPSSISSREGNHSQHALRITPFNLKETLAKERNNDLNNQPSSQGLLSTPSKQNPRHSIMNIHQTQRKNPNSNNIKNEYYNHNTNNNNHHHHTQGYSSAAQQRRGIMSSSRKNPNNNPKYVQPFSATMDIVKPWGGSGNSMSSINGGGFLSRPKTLFQDDNNRFENDYEILTILGSGCFGTVFKCANKLDGNTYAVKVTKEEIKGENSLKQILKEALALAALSACDEVEHIVRYNSAWIEDRQLHLVMEYCDTNLADILANSESRTQGVVGQPSWSTSSFTAIPASYTSEIKTPTNNKITHSINTTTHNNSNCSTINQLHEGRDSRGFQEGLKKVFAHVLKGLHYLHSQNLVHLDLKPENILYSVRQKKFKIADLGLALIAAKNSDDAAQSSVQEGDSRYLAKEILNYYAAVDLRKADIFSFGAMMYGILIDEDLPLNGDEWHAIRNKQLPKLEAVSGKCDPDLKALIASMMHPDPELRPTTKELLGSTYMNAEIIHEIKWQKIRKQILLEKIAKLESEDRKNTLPITPAITASITTNTFNHVSTEVTHINSIDTQKQKQRGMRRAKSLMRI